jgi:hypothetical protein
MHAAAPLALTAALSNVVQFQPSRSSTLNQEAAVNCAPEKSTLLVVVVIFVVV